MTARLRRDAGRRGGLNRLVGVLDCFLQRRRRAAGAAQAQVKLRVTLQRSVLCEEKSKRGLGRCARGKGRE
jgi:hypothetical protein